MGDSRRVELIGGPGHNRATVLDRDARWLEVPVPLGGKAGELYWTFHYRVQGNKAIWIRRN